MQENQVGSVGVSSGGRGSATDCWVRGKAHWSEPGPVGRRQGRCPGWHAREFGAGASRLGRAAWPAGLGLGRLAACRKRTSGQRACPTDQAGVGVVSAWELSCCRLVARGQKTWADRCWSSACLLE